jgi:hypothetical protein
LELKKFDLFLEGVKVGLFSANADGYLIYAIHEFDRPIITIDITSDEF